jgi:hypothetical protein
MNRDDENDDERDEDEDEGVFFSSSWAAVCLSGKTGPSPSLVRPFLPLLACLLYVATAAPLLLLSLARSPILRASRFHLLQVPLHPNGHEPVLFVLFLCVSYYLNWEAVVLLVPVLSCYRVAYES